MSLPLLTNNRKIDRKSIDLVHDFAKQAWALSEDQIATLEPGNIDEALKLIEDMKYKLDKHCFYDRTDFEIANPDIHLLKLMRQPQFFPLTCKILFNMNSDSPLLIMPYQNIVLSELWQRQFPMLIATRGGSKTFLLALYVMLRMLFCQGAKVVVVGAAFRQAKLVFEYMERLWYNSPVFRDIAGEGKKDKGGRNNGPRRDIDRCEFVVGDSSCIVLPMGDGEKIRGIRSNYTIVDEFASVNIMIFEKVIQAYGAVSADPVQNFYSHSHDNFLKRLGFWNEDIEKVSVSKKRGNQNVLSGTPDYSFGHFYRYWKDYKAIIETRNIPDEIRKICNGELPKTFDARDYSIIRLPYDLIPKGYMDDKTVARAEQISNSAQFQSEYQSVFITDTDGFYKRSLIHKCEIRNSNTTLPVFESCDFQKPNFTAAIRGRGDKSYFYGIDPASESDDFAITIIENWEDHRRVVYCWTIDKERHRDRVKKKVTSEHDFYKYCNRKVRDLMRIFPPTRILIDSGGGGVALREAFRDMDKLQDGEKPLYETIDYDKPKDTDDLDGHHIVEMVHFQNAAWVSEANHGMKKDMEEQILLFPANDALDVSLAMEDDILAGKYIRVERDGKEDEVIQLYDGLEECVLEIEEMKNELATIVITTTERGQERWGTPSQKLAGQKKGKLRKDRYSSLLIANMGTRQHKNIVVMNKLIEQNAPYDCYGGFAKNIYQDRGFQQYQKDRRSYPSWFKPFDEIIG